MRNIKSLTGIVLISAVLGSCIEVNGPTDNQEPRARISASTYDSIYSGNSISFNGSRSIDYDGEIVSYRWDFGDGDTATGIQVRHRFEAVGYFSTCLRVTDNEGAFSRSCVGVNVLAR